MKDRDLGHRPARQDRLIHEQVHDPYQTRMKPREPSACPDCDVVYHKGRWQWSEKPAEAERALCPACHRIKDGQPAGVVTLSGGFLGAHREEILHLARNQEAREKGQHALARIMAVEDDPESGGVVVTTTDIHLPRRIGEAVHSAYQGDLDFAYDEEGYFIRVTWRREA